MIDRYLLPLQKRLLKPLAAFASARGLSANTVTLTGFVVGLLAVPALALDHHLLALLLIFLNRFLDGLDGAIAREAGPTDQGAFLDIALDFFFYATVPLGFAMADPTTNALPAAVLIASFVGTGSSFLTFAIMAERRGLTAESYPQKGIYYLEGLAEGTETIAIFAIMCLWPAGFAWLAYFFAAICMLTTLTRWHQGWTAFNDTKNAFERGTP